jgi:hypothetical protein
MGGRNIANPPCKQIEFSLIQDRNSLSAAPKTGLGSWKSRKGFVMRSNMGLSGGTNLAGGPTGHKARLGLLYFLGYRKAHVSARTVNANRRNTR